MLLYIRNKSVRSVVYILCKQRIYRAQCESRCSRASLNSAFLGLGKNVYIPHFFGYNNIIYLLIVILVIFTIPRAREFIKPYVLYKHCYQRRLYYIISRRSKNKSSIKTFGYGQAGGAVKTRQGNKASEWRREVYRQDTANLWPAVKIRPNVVSKLKQTIIIL